MKDKTIGLVCATLNNYGSLLQTFALQEMVRCHGVKSEIVKYKEPVLSKLRRMQNIEYLKVMTKKILLSHQTGRRELTIQRSQCFEQFRQEHLIFSSICYNHRQLTEQANKYLLVILGSDQLWQPMNLLMDFFTLNFVPDKVTKASYAASFGISKLPKKMEDSYRQFISRFEYLSCREDTGADLVKQLTGRDAKVVCDPTLLIDAKEWERVMSSKVKISGNYIFCYFLGANENHRQLAVQWAKRTGCSIVALPHIVEYVPIDEEYADNIPYEVGPAEFLYLIKHAAYIFTDSFHATVFSLQFHKQFFVFDRFENGKGRSTISRIETLLSVTGLRCRLIEHGACLNSLAALSEADFEDVDKKIIDFRKSSLGYLKDILSIVL